jgi:hypothetical protein
VFISLIRSLHIIGGYYARYCLCKLFSILALKWLENVLSTFGVLTVRTEYKYVWLEVIFNSHFFHPELTSLIAWLIMMGWHYVSILRPPTGLLFIPRVICEHEELWWWCRLRITPDSSTRALWQSYQQRHLGQVGGMDQWVRILSVSINSPHCLMRVELFYLRYSLRWSRTSQSRDIWLIGYTWNICRNWCHWEIFSIWWICAMREWYNQVHTLPLSSQIQSTFLWNVSV